MGFENVDSVFPSILMTLCISGCDYLITGRFD